MRRAATFSVAILLVLLAGGPARADHDAGEAAFHRGDFEAARAAWAAPAEEGDARARYRLGMLLLLEADMRGLPMLRASAEAGHLPAQVQLGTFQLAGWYGPDRGEAVRWLERAIRQDPAARAEHPVDAARAQERLAYAYEDGIGVPKDAARAIALLREAAEAGYPPALVRLGIDLALGEVVARDLVAAHKYFVLAWKQDLDAGQKLTLMTRRMMSPAQLKRSKAAVRAWLDAKAAGTLGQAWGEDARRSRGEKAFGRLETVIEDAVTTALLHARGTDADCEDAWLRSREVVSGKARAAAWSERWVVETCGRSVAYTVRMQAKQDTWTWTLRPAGTEGAAPLRPVEGIAAFRAKAHARTQSPPANPKLRTLCAKQVRGRHVTFVTDDGTHVLLVALTERPLEDPSKDIWLQWKLVKGGDPRLPRSRPGRRWLYTMRGGPNTPSGTMDWAYVFDRNRDGKVDYLAYLDGPNPVVPNPRPASFDRLARPGTIRFGGGVWHVELESASEEERAFVHRHTHQVFWHMADDDFDGSPDAYAVPTRDLRTGWVDGYMLARSSRFDRFLDRCAYVPNAPGEQRPACEYTGEGPGVPGRKLTGLFALPRGMQVPFFDIINEAARACGLTSRQFRAE